ncbi:MAG TPA: aldolase/citrate lyase family protein [Actinomycetota bacterium]|nr:aldolase/citrate lyase family protein [Actinomycetota bacterium]
MAPDSSTQDAALRTLLNDQPVVGTFIKLASLETIDIAHGAGFDFVLIDMEHSQLDLSSALLLVRHALAIGVPAVARVPTVDDGIINQLLEAGAAGIQLSDVRRVDQVIKLKAATTYPPAGRRSVSLAQPAAGYGSRPLQEVVQAPPPVLVGQIEAAETDDPLDAILEAGLDVAFIGAVDLLVELGLDKDALSARIDEIQKAAVSAGVTLGAYAASPTDIRDGMRYVALSSDLALLQSAAKSALAEARAALSEGRRQ